MGDRTPGHRVAADVLGDADLVRKLASLSGSDLANLLLAAHAERTTSPSSVARQYDRDPFVGACDVDQRAIVALDAHLLGVVPARFEAVELSPVAPLGAVTALGPVSPYHVVPTYRGTEVVADPTNVMALIAARRRETEDVVRLVTVQRLVRALRLPSALIDRGFRQHFRLLALSTAGRDPGGRRFEEDVTVDHVSVLIDVLRSLPSAGFAVGDVSVVLSADDGCAAVLDRVRGRLGEAYRDVPVVEDAERQRKSRYYQGLSYKVCARAPDGQDVPIGDGGLVDWVAKLRSDRKERFAIAALGTELLFRRYGTSSSSS